MIHPVLVKVRSYLDKANRGEVSMSEAVMDRAALMVKEAFDKQFNKPRRVYRQSMSNVGKPICQQKLDKEGAAMEPFDYSMKMKMIYGDMIEVAAKAIMEEAGVVFSGAENVELQTKHGYVLPGELDMVFTGFDDRVYDIKSCSGWAFRNKFQDFQTLMQSDTFGYVAQLVGYSAAKGKKPGGWVVISKETGEWHVLEFPDDAKLVKSVLKDIEEAVTSVQNDAPFRREFTDEEETWYKKPTGNRVLGHACEWCQYKWSCWPNLEYLPQLASKGKYPQYKYYTHIDDKWEWAVRKAKAKPKID